MRLRFDARELTLLKSAEQLRGARLAHTPRPDMLRAALSLAKAGHKIGVTAPGSQLSLEEHELSLLHEALRFAIDDLQWASRAPDGQDSVRREAVMQAFPELVEKGSWRTFGIVREIEALGGRLQAALKS